MKICFCIPTYNRSTQLLAALNSIQKYARVSSHQIQIFVANNCSPDNTSVVLEEFSRTTSILTYINRDVFTTEGHYSIIRLMTEVPDNCDWYWFFGDDDYLVDDKITSLDETFLRKDISYIYAPPVGDIINQFEIDTVSNFVDKFGFIQFLGFMTSQIINFDALQKARKIISAGIQEDVRNLFAHSFVFYEALANLPGCTHPIAVTDTYPDRGGGWKFQDWIYTSKYLARTIDAHTESKVKPIGFFKYKNKIIWRWYFVCIFRFITSLENEPLRLQAQYAALMESLHLVLELIRRLDNALLSSSDQLVVNLGIAYLKHLTNERGQNIGYNMLMSDLKLILTNTTVLWEQ